MTEQITTLLAADGQEPDPDSGLAEDVFAEIKAVKLLTTLGLPAPPDLA